MSRTIWSVGEPLAPGRCAVCGRLGLGVGETVHAVCRGTAWRCPEREEDADGCYCAEDAEPIEGGTDG